MYLLKIYFENTRENGTGKFYIKKYRNTIAKWTFLLSEIGGLELLQLIALACGGIPFSNRIPNLRRFVRDSYDSLQLEFILTPHFPIDGRTNMPPIFGSGIQINKEGLIDKIKLKDYHLLPFDISKRNLALGTGNTFYFFVGYGSEPKPSNSNEKFDFSDPFFRVARFHSLFGNEFKVSNPVDFLTHLNLRAVRFSRYPAKQTLTTLCNLFDEYLSINTSGWMEKENDFEREWSSLHPWQRRAVLPILDSVRHMMDAFPHAGEPLKTPGLMLLNRPDHLCPTKIFPKWVSLLDRLMPKMQFILTLSRKSYLGFPPQIKKKRLILPETSARPEQKVIKVPTDAVLLIDIDSCLPNLALMKLSTYCKEQGKRVILGKKDCCIKNVKEVYASCIFHTNTSLKRIKRLKAYYGDRLIVGGSGVDIYKRLPPEIEKLPADYDLYPELEDRAIGFITRGCPGKCPFCIVPAKEGKPHQVSDLSALLGKGRRKLILLDDNILAHPKAEDFLEEMATRNLKVNFTQTLDIRLIDKERAKILKHIHCSNTRFTRRNYHFSLNNTDNLDMVAQKYRMFGFTPRDNVEFICMYGYNTTLREDVERFRFLRSLRGAYVFVQQYQPTLKGPIPNLDNFFDDDADELIDELVGILFAQNMKSMEKYYRWLSKFYAETFGRLHERLVDTLFKYNYRDRKGQYIATLAGTIARKNCFNILKTFDFPPFELHQKIRSNIFSGPRNLLLSIGK